MIAPVRRIFWHIRVIGVTTYKYCAYDKVHSNNPHFALTRVAIDCMSEQSIRLIIKFEKRLIIKSLMVTVGRISSVRSKSLAESIIDRKLARVWGNAETFPSLSVHTFQSHAHVTSPSKHRVQFTKQLRKRETFSTIRTAHQSTSSLTNVVINPPDTPYSKSLTFCRRHATIDVCSSYPPQLLQKPLRYCNGDQKGYYVAREQRCDSGKTLVQFELKKRKVCDTKRSNECRWPQERCGFVLSASYHPIIAILMIHLTKGHLQINININLYNTLWFSSYNAKN